MIISFFTICEKDSYNCVFNFEAPDQIPPKEEDIKKVQKKSDNNGWKNKQESLPFMG